MEQIKRFNTISVKEPGIYDVIMGIIKEFKIEIISAPLILDFSADENNVVHQKQLESKTRRVFLHYGDDILQNIREAISQFSRIYTIVESDCRIIHDVGDGLEPTGKLTVLRHHLSIRGILKEDE